MPLENLLKDGVPQLTTSARRANLEQARFLDVRHLAYIQYKKADQTPLMTYEETLDNREHVFRTVLAYEFSQGWLIPDGTEGQDSQTQTTPAAQPQQENTEGAQQMTTQFQPPPGGIPQQTFAPPPPVGQPVQAPPQQPIPQPGFAAAPPAQPQIAAPPQQEQPAVAPTGKRGRGRPPGGGNAVAPPPPAPPLASPTTPSQQQFQQQGTSNMLPPNQQFQPQQPPPQSFQPQGFQPQQPQGFAPPPQQQFQAPAPVQQMAPPPVQNGAAPAIDLAPIIGRQDATAAMVSALQVELAATRKELADVKGLLFVILAAQHHFYMVNPALQPQQGQPPLPKTLPEFQQYMQRFIGTSPQ